MKRAVRWLMIGLALLVFMGPIVSVAALYPSCPARRVLDGNSLLTDFVYDPAELNEKSRIAVLIPGALNSIDIFADAGSLREHGFALVYYRHPGMDGRPLDDRVAIRSVANEVATFAARYQDKRIYLVGYSIGGQIALESATMMPDHVDKVAVLAGSAGFPDTLGVLWRTLRWLAARAWALGTLDFGRIWKEYYKVMLFGEAGVSDGALSLQADRIVAARGNKIITPTPGLVCSHMGDIAWQTPVAGARLGNIPVGFFHGEYDVVSPFANARAYGETFRRTSFKVLSGQGHLVFLTAPDLFEDVARFFLD